MERNGTQLYPPWTVLVRVTLCPLQDLTVFTEAIDAASLLFTCVTGWQSSRRVLSIVDDVFIWIHRRSGKRKRRRRCHHVPANGESLSKWVVARLSLDVVSTTVINGRKVASLQRQSHGNQPHEKNIVISVSQKVNISDRRSTFHN